MPQPQARPVTEPSRRFIFAVGASGLLILILGGFVAGSLLRADDGPSLAGASNAATATASPSPQSTASDEPTPVATPSPSSATTADATPVPAPAGPPEELAVGGWATVTVGELNVRAEPDASSATNYRLVEGAVAHVAEGPTNADGFAWYRIASLGGARGWAASGPASEPYLATLVESDDLVRCGVVDAKAITVVNGAIQALDPLHVGGMALPAAAFSPEELGALQLMHATGGEACFSASIDGDGALIVLANFNYYACGRAKEVGNLFELHPSTGMDVVVEYQVKDVAVIHPAILDRSGNPQAAANVRGILSWMVRSGGWGCLSHGVNEGPDGSGGGVQLDARGCGNIEAHSGGQVVLRAASGGDAVTLVGTTVDPSLPIGEPASIIAWFFDFPGEQSSSLAPYEFGGAC